MIRLQKFLADAGITSRRKAEDLISDGKIKINNQTAKLGDKVDLEKDKIFYQNNLIKIKSNKIYIALNKPVGYISSTDSSQGKSVLDLVKIKERIYPVGRLDKDSSGLIILTNDGEFTNQLTHPRYGSEKEYLVTLDRELEKSDTKTLESGMIIDGKKTQPISVVEVKNKIIKIILKEGMNRQIRKMIGHLGYRVEGLERIRIGKLELGDLKEGYWKYINSKDL